MASAEDRRSGGVAGHRGRFRLDQGADRVQGPRGASQPRGVQCHDPQRYGRFEAEGYIAQLHTSSGRVPTEKGYREFVNRLHGVKPLSVPERRAILSFLESGVDLDDVLRRAVRLLAQLTRQVAVVQYPTLSASTVRHLEVVADPGPAADGGDHRFGSGRSAHRRTR